MNCTKCNSAMRDLSVTGVSLWHCDLCEALKEALAARQQDKVRNFSFNYAQEKGMGAEKFKHISISINADPIVPPTQGFGELVVPTRNYDLLCTPDGDFEELPAYEEIRAEMMADMEQAIGQRMDMNGVFGTLVNSIARQLAALHDAIPDEEGSDDQCDPGFWGGYPQLTGTPDDWADNAPMRGTAGEILALAQGLPGVREVTITSERDSTLNMCLYCDTEHHTTRYYQIIKQNLPAGVDLALTVSYSRV